MPNIESISNAVRPIAFRYGLKKVFLFGSYAKGTAMEDSDIDLLVEKGEPLSLLKLAGLRQSFQDELNVSVDLLTTSGIDEKFRKEIEDTEVLLYEA